MIKAILAHKVVAVLVAVVMAAAGTTAGVVVAAHPFSGVAQKASITQVTPGNGSATISWTAPVTPAVTGYRVSIIPTYTDRVPAAQKGVWEGGANGGTVSVLLPPTARTYTFGGLLEDCHQRYQMLVQTATAGGLSPPVATPSFRPSGIVAQGHAPPYVVVLVDGINSSSPGFTMNPYDPGSGVKSYCPESWWPASNGRPAEESESSPTGVSEGGFYGPGPAGNTTPPSPENPHGPRAFFQKWNVGEPGDINQQWESEPKALNGNGGTGSFTHDFMLDDVAAQGAIILPFSYHTPNCKPSAGAQLTGSAQNPDFNFPGYNGTDSTVTKCVGPLGSISEGPVTLGEGGFGFGPGVNYWGSVLDSELASIHRVWPTSRVVVIGHSQGGLVVTNAWLQGFNLPGVEAFSLDSPINGSCGTPNLPGQLVGSCFGPPGYPAWDSRTTYDGDYLRIDQSEGNPMHFIGTYGDSPAISVPHLPITAYSYGKGAETLEHQMPFDYGLIDRLTGTTLAGAAFVVASKCNVEAGAKVNPDCPAPSPPDHISRCSVDYNGDGPGGGPAAWIQETGHFVVKYCPDVISYINGITLANPPADAIAAWKATFDGCASTMAAALRHVADLLPSSDVTQIADLNQFATLPLSELSGALETEGQADLNALNKFFGTDRALTTFTGPCFSTTPPVADHNSPADAVDGFYQNELAGDWLAVPNPLGGSIFTGACSYVVPDAQALCDAGTATNGAATGQVTVGHAAVVGDEALVPVTGNICAPSSPCVENDDPTTGMPIGPPFSPSDFAAAYQAAVASTINNGTTMSPVPVTEVNGQWYVNFGGLGGSDSPDTGTSTPPPTTPTTPPPTTPPTTSPPTTPPATPPARPANALAAWNAMANDDAAELSAAFTGVANDLPSSDATQIAELNQLANLPQTGDTSAQMAEAQADVTALDKFFNTPGFQPNL